MAMPVHEVWFLLALALIIGGFGGSLIGNWWAQRQCCECCTCEDCISQDVPWPGDSEGRIAVVSGLATMPDAHAGPGYRRSADTSPSAGRRTIVLDPGPTIYPELAALADEVMDGPESHAERPVSTVTLWADEVILGWEQRFPIVRSA